MSKDLTIADAQAYHPWNRLGGGYGAVPYSPGVRQAEQDSVPHIQASHAVLHAAKSVGKLAAVYESLDHRASRPVGVMCHPNGGYPAGPHKREPLPSYLAEVWEKRGRPETIDSTNPWRDIREEPTTADSRDIEQVRAMSADLVTAALRLAWLHGFDLGQALNERAEEKNGVSIVALRGLYTGGSKAPNPHADALTSAMVTDASGGKGGSDGR